MHQESNSRQAVVAASTARPALSAMPADESAPPFEGQRSEPVAERASQRQPRVITPAVERVLAWHRRRSM